MGESKRKKHATTEFEAAVVPATYRPARIVLVRDRVGETADDPWAFGRLVASRAGVGNAMGGDVSRMPEAERLTHGPNDWPAFEVATGELRATGEADAALVPIPGSPGVLYAFTGPEVTYHAAISGGLTRADGTRVEDPRAEMAGLLRLDPAGVPVVEADAPLFIQLIALRRRLKLTHPEGTPDDASLAHARHLAALHMQVVPHGGRSYGAWIDHDRMLSVAMDEAVAGPDSVPVTEADEVDAALGLADVFPPDRPASVYGPRIGISPSFWGRRDHPGHGVVWEDADKRVSAMGAAVPRPTNGADIAIFDMRNDPGAASRIRGHLKGLERIGGLGEATAHRDGDTVLATYVREGFMHLVASPPEDPGAPVLSDPLMTEGLLSVQVPDAPAFRGFEEDLGALGFLRELPNPMTLELYPVLALVRAESEGATFADLLASFADAARFPQDEDGAFEVHCDITHADADAFPFLLLPDDTSQEEAEAHFARRTVENAEMCDRLLALGGRVLPRLRALFAPLLEGTYYAGADADARLLVTAARRGARIRDLAYEVGLTKGYQ